MNKLAQFLCGGELSKETLIQAEKSCYTVIDKPLQQYSSYFLRTALAAVIATGGIAADSTAVVVGSMIVAPLMSPMIGVALGAVLGRPRSTARALLITAAGMALSVAVAMLVALILPVGLDAASNSQILSRTSPRLTDFVIALGSSFMASIVVMRKDIPDALAGVAIAVSIIPPLCVVGVALTLHDFAAAQGSFLLFMTNFFAIQIAGMATFAVMGVGKRVYSEASRRMRALWYGAIVLCVGVICIPLTMTSNSIVSAAIQEKAIRATATTWLSGTSYSLKSIDVNDGHVSLEVVGSGVEPSMKALGARLQENGIEVKDIRMAVIKEQWYRPSAHPAIPEKSPEELEATSKGEPADEASQKQNEASQNGQKEDNANQQTESESKASNSASSANSKS